MNTPIDDNTLDDIVRELRGGGSAAVYDLNPVQQEELRRQVMARGVTEGELARLVVRDVLSEDCEP